MRSQFIPQGGCFINKHYDLIREFRTGAAPINRADSLELMKRVQAGPPATFTRLYEKSKPDVKAGP
jgi:hypothetical protein